jgi:hypothetical protein
MYRTKSDAEGQSTKMATKLHGEQGRKISQAKTGE